MLTEYTTPGESVEVRDDESIYSLLTGRIARTGEDTVIAERKTAPGQWTKVTTGEFHNAVLAAAKGLIAFGINKGDAVTIVLHHPLRVGRAGFRARRDRRGERADLRH